jgi:hypothetical protein
VSDRRLRNIIKLQASNVLSSSDTGSHIKPLDFEIREKDPNVGGCMIMFDLISKSVSTGMIIDVT